MIMETCVNCKYAGRPTYKSPCSECQGYNKYEAVEIRTNGDRIRAMSDEEIAEFFGKTPICERIPIEKCSEYDACPDCWFAWLKQPVKEDN